MKHFLVALIMVAGMGTVYAWTPPPATPPLDNVPAPINIGGTTQSKDGIFGSHGFFSFGKAYIMGGSSGPYDTTDFATDLSWITSNWPSAVNLALLNYGSFGADVYCDDVGMHCKAGDDLESVPIVTHYRRFGITALENYDYDFYFPHTPHGIADISVNLHSNRIQADEGGLVRTYLSVNDVPCASGQDARDSEYPVIKDFYTSASCTVLLDGTTESKITLRIYVEPADGYWGHYPVIDVVVMSNPEYTP